MGHERKQTVNHKPGTYMDCLGEVGVLLVVHSLYVSVKVLKEETAWGSGIDKCCVVTQCTEPIPF